MWRVHQAQARNPRFEVVCSGVLGNVVGSGTALVDQYGAEHLRTGSWIVYTSAGVAGETVRVFVARAVALFWTSVVVPLFLYHL